MDQERERCDMENRIYNSAVDMKEFIAMRREIPKRPTWSESDVPRDKMKPADYCRVKRNDRDVLGRRIK